MGADGAEVTPRSLRPPPGAAGGSPAVKTPNLAATGTHPAAAGGHPAGAGTHPVRRVPVPYAAGNLLLGGRAWCTPAWGSALQSPQPTSLLGLCEQPGPRSARTPCGQCPPHRDATQHPKSSNLRAQGAADPPGLMYHPLAALRSLHVMVSPRNINQPAGIIMVRLPSRQTTGIAASLSEPLPPHIAVDQPTGPAATPPLCGETWSREQAARHIPRPRRPGATAGARCTANWVLMHTSSTIAGEGEKEKTHRHTETDRQTDRHKHTYSHTRTGTVVPRCIAVQ